MTELMARRTDTHERFALCAIQLARAGIGVNRHAIKLQTAAVIPQSRLMRPDQVRVGSRVVLSMTGKDHEHLVNLAVTIPVVVGVVHFSLSPFHHLRHHLIRVRIVAVFSGLTVVRLLLRHDVRSHDVEVDFQLTVALCLEEIPYRSLHAEVAVSLLVEEVLKHRHRVFHRELDVLELHQNHQSAFLSRQCTRRCTHSSCATPVDSRLVCFLQTFAPDFLHLFQVNTHIVTRCIHAVRPSVLVGVEAVMLITA